MKIKNLLPIFLSCSLIMLFAFQGREITSIHDERIPDFIRQQILAFKFSDKENTLKGSSNETAVTIEKGKLNYTYSVYMTEKGLKGFIELRRKKGGEAMVREIRYQISIPKILQCCKKKDEIQCFDPDETDKIKKAKEDGCKNWFKKVVG